jgi:hypothetical protein
MHRLRFENDCSSVCAFLFDFLLPVVDFTLSLSQELFSIWPSHVMQSGDYYKLQQLLIFATGKWNKKFNNVLDQKIELANKYN